MRVGFIGLGNMGRHMAMHVLQGGHEVVVHDLRREAADAHLEASATWADSPRAVAEASELVFTSLPGPREVEAVALGAGGLLEAMTPGSTYVDLSTNSPVVIRRIASEFRARGIEMLDAPVSGGSRGAEARSLAVMVGGDAATYERVKPVLDLIGDKVSYIGEIGSGAVAKLTHNMISLTTRAVVAEAFTVGIKAGVDPRSLLRAVQGGSFGQGRLLSHVVPDTVFPGAFDRVGFALDLALKDLRLAVEMARELDVPARFAALAEAEALEGVAEGWGELDSSVIFRLQERRAGVEVRA